jgi:hypothetical protein
MKTNTILLSLVAIALTENTDADIESYLDTWQQILSYDGIQDLESTPETRRACKDLYNEVFTKFKSVPKTAFYPQHMREELIDHVNNILHMRGVQTPEQIKEMLNWSRFVQDHLPTGASSYLHYATFGIHGMDLQEVWDYGACAQAVAFAKDIGERQGITIRYDGYRAITLVKTLGLSF